MRAQTMGGTRIWSAYSTCCGGVDLRVFEGAAPRLHRAFSRAVSFLAPVRGPRDACGGQETARCDLRLFPLVRRPRFHLRSGDRAMLALVRGPRGGTMQRMSPGRSGLVTWSGTAQARGPRDDAQGAAPVSGEPLRSRPRRARARRSPLRLCALSSGGRRTKSCARLALAYGQPRGHGKIVARTWDRR